MPSAPTRLLEEAAYLLRFGLVGVANTLLGGAVIIALQWGCGLDPFLANAGGFSAGVIVGFILNRTFTFRTKHSSAAMLRYMTAVALAFLVNLAVLGMAQAALPAFVGKAVLAQLAAMSAYTVVSFLLCRFWVFGGARAATGTQAAGIV